ncbi:MAG: hypothetical protein QOJ52_4036 [Acidimicrobiaceae bacterium]|jgi:hypothetical protein|nr:hypothetical protein [Acidimicrobiaceae bacterium]
MGLTVRSFERPAPLPRIPFCPSFYRRSQEVLRFTTKVSRSGLKPIPDKQMAEWARVASQAH